MEKQTITIYDVAREANVSMATVSRVVNGNPNVKPTTRKKVLEVIERLDYRPNAVARGLASRCNHSGCQQYVFRVISTGNRRYCNNVQVQYYFS